VARVSRIEHRPGEPFASIVATPSAHLERSREVLLVWTLASTLAEAEAAARADKGFVEAPPETPTGPAQTPAEPSLP
jgi:rod shape-determining protein MreC